MITRRRMTMGGILLLALLLSAFAWYRHRQDGYRMVNVGGDSNQCDCSKRLER